MDLLIRNGKIVDGTGTPPREADIGILGGKIVAVGRNLAAASARELLDASGLVLAPGFIDVHSHDDLYLLLRPECREKVLQGVTTEIVGNCGLSVGPVLADHRECLLGMLGVLCPGADLGELIVEGGISRYLELLEESRPTLNVATLVGHSTVRMSVMGMEQRAPTTTELRRMGQMVARAMEEGALGMSTGLIYPPGNYAGTQELVELARVVGLYGGVYATHMRSEADSEMQALGEALSIGERAGVPVQISHHKVAGRRNWGKSSQTLALMEEARGRGLRVACDQYPYEAGMTFLAAILPPGMASQGPQELSRKLRATLWRKDLEARLQEEEGWENLVKGAGFEGIVISICRKPHYLGKTVAEIAAEEGRSAFEVIFDLLAEEGSGSMAIFFMMCEEDILRILESPWTMIGSDGMPSLGLGRVHPRMSGTFPRILSRYVGEMGVLSLEEAVRKMTSLPALTFGLREKGLIKEGMDADLVLLDPARVKDRATYQEPNLPPEGIRLVVVNGQITVREGKLTGARPGKVIRRAS